MYFEKGGEGVVGISYFDKVEGQSRIECVAIQIHDMPMAAAFIGLLE